MNPHAFRRSHATELSQDLTPSELAVLHGWVQGSRMPQVYIHLSDDDVERKLMRRMGILKEDETRSNPLRPCVCLRCGTENSAANRHCSKYTLLLDDDARKEAAKERDRLVERAPVLLQLLEDSEVGAMLARKPNMLQGPEARFIGTSEVSPA